MFLLVWLPESSGGESGIIPSRHRFHHDSHAHTPRFWDVSLNPHNPGISMEGLRKTTRNLSQKSRSPGRDLNPEPPVYEAGVLNTRPRHSVLMWMKCFCHRPAISEIWSNRGRHRPVFRIRARSVCIIQEICSLCRRVRVINSAACQQT
jgi:hypothetical protein